jgi:ligand-binding sensor domain-containing protein
MNGGVAKYEHNSKDKKWTVYNTQNSKIATDKTWSVVSDKHDNIWVCVDEWGFCRLVRDSWMTYFKLNSELKSNFITKIYVDDDDYKWLMVPGQGLLRYNDNVWKEISTKNSKLPEDYVVGMHISKNKTMWLGTFPGAGLIKVQDTSWYFYNTVTSEIPGNGASNIVEDIKGYIWFSSFESDMENFEPLGLVKFDGNNFFTFTSENSQLPTNDILAITSSRDGYIWVGTNGGGLVRIRN